MNKMQLKVADIKKKKFFGNDISIPGILVTLNFPDFRICYDSFRYIGSMNKVGGVWLKNAILNLTKEENELIVVDGLRCDHCNCERNRNSYHFFCDDSGNLKVEGEFWKELGSQLGVNSVPNDPEPLIYSLLCG